MKNRKGFTLVELLAVITILSVILIIAVPQIMNTIKVSKLGAMESSAKIIAKDAEKKYYMKKMEDKNYAAAGIPCTDITKMSSDYGSCTISYSNNGIATVTLKGATGGKFDKIKCEGTKDNMNCQERVLLPGYSDAVELLIGKYNDGANSEGLIRVQHNKTQNEKYTAVEYRYQGSNPNNYVYFNCTDNSNPTSRTCEIWRIIGLFDGRVKIVRKDSIGSFSWDSSVSSVNSGIGINQWGPSGTYEGADLMRELNGDYLNSSLSANTLWYNGSSNKKEGTFNKNYVLKGSTQKLIGDATWYTGAIYRAHEETLSLSETYAGERGTSYVSNPSDGITRTDVWVGKVGLVYASDFGYASGDFTCSSNIESCGSNWMTNYGWTISSDRFSGEFVSYANSSYISSTYAYSPYTVRPAVYLIPDIQMKGSGTTADPYVFAD